MKYIFGGNLLLRFSDVPAANAWTLVTCYVNPSSAANTMLNNFSQAQVTKTLTTEVYTASIKTDSASF